ncbi:AAA family ATPase [Saccharibacillus alkalitolerans]|uniref:MoxR family ATPase n=1 Tax=Saccharibacillus alkalitolerans TaxID=2705290 RepID=A0ABX0EZW3_9BACL|nr:MoxR family ATPase [Saccharibacillus alkalitolerans]NGZ73757.1 MoxR family ATPase [Saccharibacillus alkalitolerans]
MSVSSESMQIVTAVRTNLESCILGKTFEIKLLMTALLAGGHVLIEDVPGTGKTQMIKALARSMEGVYRRVQCNPDLLPTDITGVSIYHPREERFQFRPGPIMSHILLADEINRATTKTQSALLEAMEERSVTVDGETHPLPHPFMLCATQNPIDFEGTYVLPEAQLDRFMMKLHMGYPDLETEKNLISANRVGQPADQLRAVTDMDTIAGIQREVREVHMNEAVTSYMLNIIRATREHPSVLLGASPRASISFALAAKAYAFINERDFVLPDDIKELAPFVLPHRILIRPEARLDSLNAESLIRNLLAASSVPVSMGR